MHMFLDDERFPPNDGNDWHIVRSVPEAVGFKADHGCPKFISFDHDLGGDEDAIGLVHWMIGQDFEKEGFIPEDFAFYVHSQNPIGAKNIQSLLDNYLEFRKDYL